MSGLEDNAAFRIMIAGARPAARWRRYPWVEVGGACLVVALCIAISEVVRLAFPQIAPFASLSYWIGFWLAGKILARPLRAGSPDRMRHLGLTREVLADLHLCGFPPRDVAIAIWARSIPRIRIKLIACLACCAYAGMLPILSLDLQVAAVSDEWLPFFKASPIFVAPLLTTTVAWFVASRAAPEFALARTRLRMDAAAGGGARGREEGWIALGLLMGSLATLIAFLPEMGKEELPEFVTRWAAPSSVPLAILGGWMLGRLYRRSNRLQSDTNIDRIAADLRSSMQAAADLRFGGSR